MFLRDMGTLTLLNEEHFFWDTWYIILVYLYLVVSYMSIKIMNDYEKLAICEIKILPC